MIPEWNSFINADCMDYLKEFPDNYFSLAIVDPPYGSGLCENGGCMGRWAKYHQNAETLENLRGGGTRTEILEPLWAEVRSVQRDTSQMGFGSAGKVINNDWRQTRHKQKNDNVGRCPWKRIF